VSDFAIAPPALIHPTALVSPEAAIGAGTSIGPYSVIGGGVQIGNNNRIGPHVVIDGHTILGDSNQIYPFASIGAAPQDQKYDGEASVLRIGSRNIIREYATLQPGTMAGGGQTIVGDDNLFMAYSHVAHDCHIGDHVRLSNAATLAGHIEIGEGAILSGLCAIHQFVRIGKLAFVSGGAMVTQDVPPFCIVQGDRARLVSLNHIGLQRAGIAEHEIAGLKRVFRIMFRSTAVLADRIATAAGQIPKSDLVRELLDFVSSSSRGVVSARRASKPIAAL
jgi:UDP-N-acetylglucosamine acyltransferase